MSSHRNGVNGHMTEIHFSRFSSLTKINVMHFLFPLLFSQLIVLHKVISFPPHYFFGLLLAPILTSVKRNVLSPFAVTILFLLISSWADNAFREAIQILIELAFGYVIARFFIVRYSHDRIRNFFKRTLLVWAGIVLVYMSDYYFFGRFLNSISYLVTDWESGGTSTAFARISILWGNPNWLSFFYLVCFALYVEFNGRSLTLSVLAALILFILQTKTAIALGALLLLFVWLSELRKRSGEFLPVCLVICIISLAISQRIYIIEWIENLQNLSSFVNRQRIWDFISPTLSWYPNGLMGDGTKSSLIDASDEDSLPSIFVLLRLFGWPVVLFGLFFLTPFKRNSYLSPVTFVLLGFSITQSYLSISASCSLAFFSLFLSLSRRSYRRHAG